MLLQPPIHCHGHGTALLPRARHSTLQINAFSAVLRNNQHAMHTTPPYHYQAHSACNPHHIRYTTTRDARARAHCSSEQRG